MCASWDDTLATRFPRNFKVSISNCVAVDDGENIPCMLFSGDLTTVSVYHAILAIGNAEFASTCSRPLFNYWRVEKSCPPCTRATGRFPKASDVGISVLRYSEIVLDPAVRNLEPAVSQAMFGPASSMTLMHWQQIQGKPEASSQEGLDHRP